MSQAYAIDTKIDDGLPQSGRVLAGAEVFYANGGNYFWSGYGNPGGGFPLNATHPSTTSCYDNGNVYGVAMHYTLQNSSLVNCALSIQLQ